MEINRSPAALIVKEALQEVCMRYGDDTVPRGEQSPTRSYMEYHNLQHSLEVYNGSVQMAHELGLPAESVAVAGIAAAAHDIVHGGKRGVMERESAAWVGWRMGRSELPDYQITAAKLAILATEPTFTDGRMTGQRVSEQTYPSKSAELIAHGVACADMAILCSPAGPQAARRLFREMKGVTTTDPFPVAELIAFQEVQQTLLTEFRYSHPVGERLFGGDRDAVRRYQDTVTKKLFNGSIASWRQLIESDTRFAEQPSL